MNYTFLVLVIALAFLVRPLEKFFENRKHQYEQRRIDEIEAMARLIPKLRQMIRDKPDAHLVNRLGEIERQYQKRCGYHQYRRVIHRQNPEFELEEVG